MATPHLTSSLSRRSLLAGATAAGAALGLQASPALAAPASLAATQEAVQIDPPFTLGVASGDPLPNGFVAWTRLAPKPFEPDWGMRGISRVAVRWRVATDPAMRSVVRSGRVSAFVQWAHSVHVDIRGLEPAREYYYQFEVGGHVSEVGRARTAPAVRDDVSTVRFATASCQAYDAGFFTSYPHVIADDLDFVVYLGDYVYEYEMSVETGNRKQGTPDVARTAPVTLEQWRARHALYKSDPDLQAAHAHLPFITIWDDHEYSNDYAGTYDVVHEGGMAPARAAAYQAYWEHQPLRRAAEFKDGQVRVYRGLRWGQLAQLHLLDGRQYRSQPPCGWGEAQACTGGYDPSVTMLGTEQERWLESSLAASRARWNILGNNVMVARLDHDGPDSDLIWNDAWDGFPAARKRLLDQLVEHRVANPVFVTGDWHSTFINDVHLDFDAADSPVVATEFVGTSLTTNGDGEVYGPYYGPMIKYNPHIRFFDGDRRGYQRMTVTKSEWRTDLVMVDTVTRPTSAASVLASFVVQDGRPGAHRL